MLELIESIYSLYDYWNYLWDRAEEPLCNQPKSENAPKAATVPPPPPPPLPPPIDLAITQLRLNLPKRASNGNEVFEVKKKAENASSSYIQQLNAIFKDGKVKLRETPTKTEKKETGEDGKVPLKFQLRPAKSVEDDNSPHPLSRQQNVFMSRLKPNKSKTIIFSTEIGNNCSYE